MTEAIDGNHRETNLAGKLDALARRRGAAHPDQVHGGAAQRSSVLSPACVFVRLFSCTHTAAVVTCSRKSCRTWSPVALSPLIMAGTVLSHGMHLVQRRQVTRFNSSTITLTKMGCLNQLHL